MVRAILLDQQDALVERPEGETGDFFSSLASLFGGGGNGQASPAGGSGIGESLGSIGGGALGSFIGGPAGTAIGTTLGRLGGGLAEAGIRTLAAPKPKPGKRPRQLTKKERKILADGELMTKRTGEPAYAEEARLRVHKPSEYRKRRDAGQLPTQLAAARKAAAQAPATPPTPRVRFNFAAPTEAMPTAPEPRPAAPTTAPNWFDLFGHLPPGFQPPPVQPELADEDPYVDTAAPVTRPSPKRHLSVVPIPETVLRRIMDEVPLLKTVDPRFLRLVTGAAGAARDVAGVDPTTGQYHAEPGETPQGITKKLTGQFERTAELYAANPSHPQGSRVWNIPPGWLLYDRDTGAVTTSRSYIVLKDDTPYKIAQKMGAFSRPKWWSELRAANPSKTVTNGNWTSLYPGEEIGIPDEWPENPYAKPVGGSSTPPTPGFPGPTQNSTMDGSVIANAQILIAAWARRYNACDPADFGAIPSDVQGLMDARTQRALVSFQMWWNKWNPSRTLRADGTLDAATQNALKEAVFSPAPSYGQPPPTPQPQPPAPQLPTVPQLPALPPGFEVFPSSKPGNVLLKTPFGSFDVPVSPGSKPGTVALDVPVLGKVEIPTPVLSQQPPPPPPPPPVPVPQLPIPVPTPTAPVGLPPGVEVLPSSKPGHVLLKTPYASWDVPVGPGAKPGTAVLDVPVLGKVEVPTSILPPAAPPALPQLPPAAPVGLPPGVEVLPSAKAGHVLLKTPYGSWDVPVGPGSKPGTAVLDVPVLGKVEVPTSILPPVPAPPLPPSVPALPPGVEVHPSSKAGHVLLKTPYGSWDVPVGPGSKPGTATLDVPVLGKVEVPTSILPSAPKAPPLPPAPSSAELDANMPEADRASAESVLKNTTDPGLLDMAATMFEGMGYPKSAAAMRAKAASIRAQMPAGLYPLDPTLPAESRQLAEYVLMNGQDPDALDAMAQSFAEQGYPIAAQSLAARASALRDAQPDPYDAPQYPFPAPAPSPGAGGGSASSGGSSALPLLALLGAFEIMG